MPFDARDVAAPHPFKLLLRAAETLRHSDGHVGGQHQPSAEHASGGVQRASTRRILRSSCARRGVHHSVLRCFPPVDENIAPAPAAHAVHAHRHLSLWTSRQLLQYLTLLLRPWMSTPSPVGYAAPVPVVDYIAFAGTLHLHLSVSTWRLRQRSPRTKGTHFVDATGRCEHGLSPEFHREDAHRVVLLRLACTTCRQVASHGDLLCDVHKGTPPVLGVLGEHNTFAMARIRGRGLTPTRGNDRKVWTPRSECRPYLFKLMPISG